MFVLVMFSSADILEQLGVFCEGTGGFVYYSHVSPVPRWAFSFAFFFAFFCLFNFAVSSVCFLLHLLNDCFALCSGLLRMGWAF